LAKGNYYADRRLGRNWSTIPHSHPSPPFFLFLKFPSIQIIPAASALLHSPPLPFPSLIIISLFFSMQMQEEEEEGMGGWIRKRRMNGEGGGGGGRKD
jgi:hypothetical protein